MLMVALTPPATPPELELLELVEELLLDEELLLEELLLDELLLEEELLDEELVDDELLDDELLEEELFDEELELLDEELVDVPLQLPTAGLMPEIIRLSMFANPALLVAFRLNKLFPADNTTFSTGVIVQVAQAPVPAKASEATLVPFTRSDAERALEPFA
jgi:hypothetical protein